MKLFFATINENKLREAREILDIEVEGTPLEVDEIQSLDPVKVAVKKAKDYFRQLKKPIFVEDISFCFRALNDLPGPYINDFLKALGNDGLIALLKGERDRSAYAQATVVFVDEKGKDHTFVGKVNGSIASTARGGGFGWDPIFIPRGEKRTFGQMSMKEKNNYSMRAIALKRLKKWLKKNYNIK